MNECINTVGIVIGALVLSFIGFNIVWFYAEITRYLKKLRRRKEHTRVLVREDTITSNRYQLKIWVKGKTHIVKGTEAGPEYLYTERCTFPTEEGYLFPRGVVTKMKPVVTSTKDLTVKTYFTFDKKGRFIKEITE